MLDDATFFQFTRELNPGSLVELPHCETFDMAGNLLILYALVVGYGAKRVLEIGTNDGTSTLALLKGAAEIGGGHVTSVDIEPCDTARALVERFELAQHWTFRRGDSRDVLPQLRAEGARFDFVLVDGDHTYEATRSDVEHASAMLADGGVLLVHDCYLANYYDRVGTAKVVRELLSSPEWQGVVFPFASSMGIFQKRAPVLSALDAGLRGIE